MGCQYSTPNVHSVLNFRFTPKVCQTGAQETQLGSNWGRNQNSGWKKKVCSKVNFQNKKGE